MGYFLASGEFGVTHWLLLVTAITCGLKATLLSADEEFKGDYTNHVVAFEKNCLGFEKLEEYLQDEVNSETDLELNMKATERLMAGEMQKPIGEQDQQLLMALSHMLTLNDVMKTCDHESYEILMSLKQATRYPIDRIGASKKRVALRRIEFIMSKYAIEHALKCRRVYRDEFGKSYAKLTRSKLGQIDAIMDTLIEARLGMRGVSRAKSLGSVLRRIYASFMDMNDSFKNPKDAALILGFLNKSGLLTGNVKEDVHSHMLEPCYYYTQHLGPDIFIPAQLDSGILDRSNRYKPGVDEQHDGFIYGWARYGFCAMLQRDQNHLIKKMIALIPSN